MVKNREIKGDEVSSDDFEKVIAAALKVDPKGLAGKHSKDAQGDEESADA